MSAPEPDADSIVMIERKQFKETMSLLRQIVRELQEMKQHLQDLNQAMEVPN